MAEYIKRSDAMKVCQDYSSHCFTTNDASGQDIADRIENDIVEIPTADVVEVCRCKDCGHSEQMNSLYCNYFNKNVDEDDFCSQGG